MTEPALPSMPLLSMTTERTITHCRNLRDCADGRNTLFIASFPKSGTTWIQALIYNLLSNGNQDFNHISDYSPFFEIEKTWIFGNGPEGELKPMYEANHRILNWRVFNTHLRWEMMPKGRNMKYIYIVRSGKDVALSFFKHLSNQDDNDCFNGSLSDFLQQWCAGSIPFGNWIHHLQSWMSAYHLGQEASLATDDISHPHILLIRYQDMIINPLDCVLRIIAYLELDMNVDRAQELLSFVSFQYMKSHQHQYMPISVPWKPGYCFIRNGTLGDSDNYFTEADNAIYYDMIKRTLLELGYKAGVVPDWLTALEIV